MNDPIRAKVARVLNSREVVITAGTEQGVSIGMFFDILDSRGEDITDPDTGEMLGSIDRPKVRVRIVQVQEKLAVASTYKKERVNIGGKSSAGLLARSIMPPEWVTQYETLKTDEKTWEDLDESKSYVKRGDPVIQVMDKVDTNEELVD